MAIRKYGTGEVLGSEQAERPEPSEEREDLTQAEDQHEEPTEDDR